MKQSRIYKTASAFRTALEGRLAKMAVAENMEPPEIFHSRDWLGFAQIPPAIITAISSEQQFADKIHAYTLPRMQNPNSRVRDPVDLVLMAGSNQLIPEKARRAILGTFSRRATHPVPPFLSDLPAVWKKPFDALAAECGLQIGIDEAFRTVDIFFRSLQILA